MTVRPFCNGLIAAFAGGVLGILLLTDGSAQNLAFKGHLKKSKTASTPAPGQVLLIDLLEKIEQNNNVSFAYQKSHLAGKYVTALPQLTDSLELYLSEQLAGLDLDIRKVENIKERIYIIFPTRVDAGEDSLISQESEEIIQNEIRGHVRSPYGTDVAGVNVQVKGKTSGARTDDRGMFTIEETLTPEDTLVFSYVGYSTLELPVTTGSVNVVMHESLQSLSEVVVTALGLDRSQRMLGYATSTLHADEFSGAANTNIISSLYGKVPGMRIRTAPGGATSAVSVQIRGFSSLNYSTQPLFVIDGVLMRDANEKGSAGLNNDDYFTDMRIRGNGILDISPEDVETITVLKGASATALYGSDASGGVVLLTSKKGTAAKGMGISINYQATREEVAFTPKYQNTYGPGFNRERNVALGAGSDGWVPVDMNADGINDSRRPLFESNAQFGPRFDGQPAAWWDGTTKTYQAQPNNYKDLHRKGFNSIFNVALANRKDNLSYRISYTNNTYEGIQVGGKLTRNTVHVSTSYKFNSKITTDVVAYYSNSFVHNRPIKLNRLASSWTGFFSRAEPISTFFEKYQTSQGYKWVPVEQSQRNPYEALKYTTPKGYEVMDFLWQQLKNDEDERQNRLITSITLNYDIYKDLHFRGRFGTDLTRLNTETRQYNEYPTLFNGTTSTGSFGQSHGNYSFLYSDALLTYSKKIAKDYRFSVNAGVQVRDEHYRNTSTSTNGGLVLENWFSFRNSYLPSLNVRQVNSRILKYAYLGIAEFSFKDLFYVQATGRQEFSSTLPPEHNSYFYPSVNTGFVFSDAFSLPRFINYGKLRTSYGVVGNAPPAYEANVLYELTTLQTVNGPVVSAGTNGDLYGNNNIRPELRHEFEAGMELWMLNSRLGFDLTFYQSRTKDQILKLDLPSSVGASGILANAGVLESQGWELGLMATPLNGKLKWTGTLNAAMNKSVLNHLVSGIDQLVFRDFESGSVQIVAEPGQPIGNIYVHPRMTDDQGKPIIHDDGLYLMDKTRYIKAGNILPRITGGLGNRISFRNVSLDAQIDCSFGGQIVSPPLKYGKGSGLYQNTMQYRDAEHGGLAYYVDGNGQNILIQNTAAVPDGATVFHDGMILQGVTTDGSVNTKVIDAASYYLKTYDWGNNAWNEDGIVYDNSYIKLREIVLTYSFPVEMVSRLHLNYMRFSIIGRNLCYFWRTLDNLDPEATIGSSWLNQGIDEGSEAATRSYGFSVKLGF